MNLKDALGLNDKIRPLDEKALKEAEIRQQMLAKPPGSLGKLEDMSVKMAGITGKLFNEINRSCVAVFSADNGVCDEGIASAPQSVTKAQTMNFLRRKTGVGALSLSFGSDLLVVDMGIKDEIPEELYTDVPFSGNLIVDRKIRRGTDNLAKKPAMSLEEALTAIETGLEMADAIKMQGYDIAGIGEMGIGNTTTSSCLLSAVTGLDSETTVGRGGGINDESFEKKKRIVDVAAAPYIEKGGISTPEEMIRAMADMGGFDICAMAGCFIGCAINRLPVVIDGYISIVAALCAYMIAPLSRDFMFGSHQSFEKGYMRASEILGIAPIMSLDMRLGEGSGCPIAFQIIKGACDVLNNMATFEEAAINDDYLDEIRRGGCF